VNMPEDLIEEAARLKGYDTLVPRAPYVAIGDAREEDAVVLKSRVREFLVRARLNEVCLHSFIRRSDAEAAVKRDYPEGRTVVELENPLNAEYECMRPSLSPGLLDAVRANSRFFDDIRAFEVGKVFAADKSGAKEALHLGIVLARKKESYFAELKGIANDLLSSFGVTDITMVERGGRLYIEADEEVIGYMEPRQMEKGWQAAVAELDLDHLLKLVSAEHEFKPLPKYPSVVRDISILCKDDVRIGEVLAVIQQAGARDVVDVDLLDEYTDEKLGGKQSLTFRIVFQAEDRTLTDGEVNMEFEKVTHALKAKVGADVR